MPTKSEAISNFLADFTYKDLADLYHYGMEVQVNVAQDGGKRRQNKDGFTGRMWSEYYDENTDKSWKSFRIPWNAATKPEYSEYYIKDGIRKNKLLLFDLVEHAEGIGMTGWDWESGISKWVAFDFDALTEQSKNQSSKLTPQEMQEVQEAACAIPWVTVRKSTGSRGLHLYVFLDDVKTKNHTEHAALARAILGKMSAETGFPFETKVDVCGGTMWVWHRKMKGTDGLNLIKQGVILDDIPPTWKDHLTVIKGARKKNLPQFIEKSNASLFEELTTQRKQNPLDDEHKRLLDYLKSINAQWWFDNDHWMMICHTADLKKAHQELSLYGIFDTVAAGTEQGADHNAFAFPINQPPGAWVVRRYTKGISEASNWDQDSSGWTRCYFNKEPTLKSAAHSFNGVEDEKGGFFFNEAETASSAAKLLGAHLNLPNWACNRTTQIKPHKDGRLVVSVKRETNDNVLDMTGWREDKGWWKRIFNALLAQQNEADFNYDNLIRHLISSVKKDFGWMIKSNEGWSDEPLNHVKIALKSFGFSEKELNNILGSCIMESWTVVNEPFQQEFPGNRRWNRNAAQFVYLPQQEEPFLHSTWDLILNHIGFGLNDDVLKNGWCSANGITTGGDYLRVWIASLFQYPKKHLPYLFLYSEQEQTGKTTFHEALCTLISKQGYCRADSALINQSSFNGELAQAILCIIEETNLRKSLHARNRIKDWLGSKQISIHIKGKTPYLIDNTTHYVQTSNKYEECPIFPGDTRITAIRVKPIDLTNMIPKDELFDKLHNEAPAFMSTILKLDIPRCTDRLNMPIIETGEKQQIALASRESLEIFLEEIVFFAPGEKILYNDLWTKFQNWLDPNEIHLWTKIRMGRKLPLKFPKGRILSENGQFYVGNISSVKLEKISNHVYNLNKDVLILEELK